MSISSHVTALQRKHEHLSAVVEAAQRQPAADDLEIAALKKHGLKKGVASLCIGGGEATALAIELV